MNRVQVVAGWLKAPARVGREAVGFPTAWLRSRRILNLYARLYETARQKFLTENPASARLPSLDEVRVRVLTPGSGSGTVKVRDYATLVNRMSRDVHSRFELSDNSYFFPRIPGGSIPARTADVASVHRGDVIALQLKEYLDIDGLRELCSELIPQIERHVYGSYVIVDKVYFYRNLESRLSEQVSWRWHYDNHPNEILKVMIYLTDVDEETGPFEYLCGPDGRATLMKARPLCGYGRISLRAVQRAKAKLGFREKTIVGPAGTMILFDNNVVHKANIPKRGHRDVVVLQIRPVEFAPALNYVDRRWTGSFPHVDFNSDPYDYSPRPKPRMLSA